jgi:hypothetical protein
MRRRHHHARHRSVVGTPKLRRKRHDVSIRRIFALDDSSTRNSTRPEDFRFRSKRAESLFWYETYTELTGTQLLVETNATGLYAGDGGGAGRDADAGDGGDGGDGGDAE